MIVNQRVRIKMCGTTRQDDAVTAVKLGVDALGFIFYEKSPRSIDPEEAKLIIEQLPPLITTVGVFVDKKRKEVEEIVQYCGLGYAQLHGQETPKYCERLIRSAAPCQVLKVLRVNDHLHAEDIAPYNDIVHGFLLDTYRKDAVGGTGETFDWSLIGQLSLRRPYLLAGGLDPDNIEEALEAVRPYGVDVNSGLEKSPGIKDHNLMREFIKKVRAFETCTLAGNN